MGGHLKRVTVVLPPDLHKDLKLKSVHDDTTMNDLILAAVRQYLSKSESEKNKSAVN
jgi:hypothetical protein